MVVLDNLTYIYFRRLFLNKKSAQKCRLKKALEFEKMRLRIEAVELKNMELAKKVSVIIITNIYSCNKQAYFFKLNQRKIIC